MTLAQNENIFFTQALPNIQIAVIGDVMLDQYIWGKAERISPEAPVPILEIQEQESRPGGAANVALNLVALGVKVQLIGLIGKDTAGEELIDILSLNAIPTTGLYKTFERPTTTKTRILATSGPTGPRQLLRLDKENSNPFFCKPFEEFIKQNILQKQWDAIIIEDYDKGVLNHEIIEWIIQYSHNHNIPVLVDPKFRNFFSYTGCTLFKPNLRELNTALELRIDKKDIVGLVEAVSLLRTKMPHPYTLVTLGDNGVLLVNPEMKHLHIAAHLRKIADVSGAGDTVISVMAAAIAAGLSYPLATQLANLAGGMVCEEAGAVAIDLTRLAQETHRLNLFEWSNVTL
ncbi:MAG: PfkB family carbohydrate kinase [Bacteroidia bacterium]|nr:PfkB family carbohydrate kinase [Bacteroidia bacterium]MDW8159306.1 PfkB family carbohydrate kinase [Bacteroidia bacterium]